MKKILRLLVLLISAIGCTIPSFAKIYTYSGEQYGVKNSFKSENVGQPGSSSNPLWTEYVVGNTVQVVKTYLPDYKNDFSGCLTNNYDSTTGIRTLTYAPGIYTIKLYSVTDFYIKIIVITDWPTHKPAKLTSPLSSVTRWERSYDNGASWTVLDDSASDTYTEQDPQRGVAMYRVLSNGKYYDVTTITYYDEVPEEIVCSPKTVSKTVDEAVTFSLDVVDDGYTYQWYQNGKEINGATGQTLTIDPVKMANAGSYYCVVKNEVSETQSTTCELTTSKCAQYITFPEIETKTYGDEDFTLPATTDKGLTIQYSSSNQSVATISGNTVHIVAPGETNITANQPGNADYLEAAYISRKLTVNKLPQAINFPEIPAKTYEDIPFTLPEKTDKGLTISYKIINPEVATVSGNTVIITGAGTTEIVASQDGDATHYAATPVTRTITVNKQSQSLNFPAFGPKVYGDAPIVLNETTDKGLTVRYEAEGDAVSIENNIVTIVRPGSAKITATQEGNKNYLAIEPIVRDITVSKAQQTINWAEIPNKTYGDEPFKLPETTDKGLAIAYSSSNESIAEVSGNTVTIKGAGSAEITASQGGDEFYNPAASVTLTINVAKAYQTISFPEFGTVVYGSAPITLAASAQSTAGMRYESSDSKVATVEGNVLTVTGAGKCYVTAYSDGDDNYYAATPVQRELSVAKSGQEVIFTEISSKTYGDEPFTLSAYSTNGQAVTFSSSAPSVISISGNTATIRGAGTAVITATQAGNNNYESASERVTVTIGKATLIATADNQTRLYGDENPDLTITWQGFVNGDSEYELDAPSQARTSAGLLSNVGSYDITIEPFSDSNYEVIVRNGLLTIEKAPLKIIAKSAEKTYGDPNPTFSVEYSGFKNGQTEMELLNRPYLTTTAKTLSPVGVYPINAEGAEARNYEPEYVEGYLTINKAVLTATLAHATREYGLENEYSVRYSGFKGSDKVDVIDVEPEVVTKADKFSDAGLYSMVLRGGEAINYEFEYAYPAGASEAIMTITKAPLTITADSKTKTYLEAMPRLTMSFDGFRNGDTADKLEQYPYISCEADPSSLPGTYPIVLTGGYDNNYEYNLVNGVLEVINASVVYVSEILFEEDVVEISYPRSVALEYAVFPKNANNQTLHWSTSDWTVATVSDGVVTAQGVGTVTITASATDGSGVTASCLVKVTDDGNSGIYSTEASKNIVYTENGVIIIKRANESDLIQIYSTNGSLVYSGYDEYIDTLVRGLYFVIIGNDVFKIKL